MLFSLSKKTHPVSSYGNPPGDIYIYIYLYPVCSLVVFMWLVFYWGLHGAGWICAWSYSGSIPSCAQRLELSTLFLSLTLHHICILKCYYGSRSWIWVFCLFLLFFFWFLACTWGCVKTFVNMTRSAGPWQCAFVELQRRLTKSHWRG